MSQKIIIALNTTWNIVNFRSGLIKALVMRGYDVVAVAPFDKYANDLDALGCRYISFPIDSQGTNPLRDLLLLIRFIKLFRSEKPNIFLGYTIKPNIYGSLAAIAVNVPVINNIAGLGNIFTKKGFLNRLVRCLYKIALSRSHKVFFQNEDDQKMFVYGGIVRQSITDRLPGSGVNLAKFKHAPLPIKTPIRFLLIARMLWDKGVGDYVESARLLRRRGIVAEFCILGFLDVQNPTAISREQMDEWVSEGIVRYLGVSDNVQDEIAQADCVVLPTFYREGTPKTLLEAAAMGRPIITTDSAGCRDVVNDGISGYLCKPRNPYDLAEKMELIVTMSSADRAAMGSYGRAKISREFDEKIVIDRYLSAIEELI